MKYNVSSWSTYWQGGATTDPSTNSFKILMNAQTMGGSMFHPVSTRHGKFCAKIDFTYHSGTNIAFYLTSVQNNNNTPGWDEVDIEFVEPAKPGYSSNFFQGGKDNTQFIGKEGGSVGGEHCLLWNWEKSGSDSGCVTWTLNGRQLRQMCNYYGNTTESTLHPVISYWANQNYGDAGMKNWMGTWSGVPHEMVATYTNVVYEDLSSPSEGQTPEVPPASNVATTEKNAVIEASDEESELLDDYLDDLLSTEDCSTTTGMQSKTTPNAELPQATPVNYFQQTTTSDSQSTPNAAPPVPNQEKAKKSYLTTIDSIYCTNGNVTFGLQIKITPTPLVETGLAKVTGKVLFNGMSTDILSFSAYVFAPVVQGNSFSYQEMEYQSSVGGQVTILAPCSYSALPSTSSISVSYSAENMILNGTSVEIVIN